MFAGRTSTLNRLESLYRSQQFRMAIVTGMRRSGKTAVLRELAKGKKCIYFPAFETTGGQELLLLQSYICRVTGKKLVANPSLLSLLDDVIDESKKGRLLFIIDDYPAFAKADSSFEKLLLSYLEKSLRESDILLVLSGNRAAYMNRHCLGEKTPVGRHADDMLNVDSINYMEAVQFCINADDYTKAVLYGVTGGLPALLSKYRDGESFRDFIIRELLCPDSEYFDLTQEMLSFDLRELSYYNRILAAIAAGKRRVLELSAEVDKPKDIIVPYLNTLMSLGIVEKVAAITEETNRKKTRYTIANSYIEFWYRFVVPNFDMLYAGEAEKLYDDIILPNLSNYMKGAFSRICADYFERRNRAGVLPFEVSRIGCWWQNAGEDTEAVDFDLLAINENSLDFITVYCSCIFDAQPVELSTLKELIGSTVILKKGADVYYMIFAAGDFNENTRTVASTIKNIVLVTLEDLYKGSVG